MVPGRPSGPVSLYGVPLPMKNCNIPFSFALIKSKYMKSVIGNEKKLDLYTSRVIAITQETRPISVCRSVVQ